MIDNYIALQFCTCIYFSPSQHHSKWFLTKGGWTPSKCWRINVAVGVVRFIHRTRFNRTLPILGNDILKIVGVRMRYAQSYVSPKASRKSISFTWFITFIGYGIRVRIFFKHPYNQWIVRLLCPLDVMGRMSGSFPLSQCIIVDKFEQDNTNFEWKIEEREDNVPAIFI